MLLVFASCSREFLVVKSVLARFYVGGPSEERLNDYASGRVAWLDYEHCLYQPFFLGEKLPENDNLMELVTPVC